MTMQRRKPIATAKEYADFLAEKRASQSPKGYQIQQKAADTAEIYIYDVIDPFWGVDAAALVKEIDGLKVSQITVRINSPGGYVTDGMAIYNALIRNSAQVETIIDGEASSMASIIALAGNTVKMADNALFMIHNPWGMCLGEAGDMRQYADVLDKMTGVSVEIYTKKSGQSEEKIREWMGATTFFTAQEAKEAGFIDEILDMAPPKGQKSQSEKAEFNSEQERARAHAQLRLATA